MFKYTAFGLPVESEFELPGLFKQTGDPDCPENTIWVRERKVPAKLKDEPFGTNATGMYNANESVFVIEGVAKFYIHQGNFIDLEAIGDNRSEINHYIYANCLAIALLQRNKVLFHCSGVFIKKNEVVLFAAPKSTGKSTLSVILQKSGFAPFTDDTALIDFSNHQCFVLPSYPLIRLTDESMVHQHIFQADDLEKLLPSIDKNGILFHDRFREKPARLAGIVFLEHDGTEIFTRRIKPIGAIAYIEANIYRKEWIIGTRKQQAMFTLLGNIAKTVPMWIARRPANRSTFNEFADQIKKDIIEELICDSL